MRSMSFLQQPPKPHQLRDTDEGQIWNPKEFFKKVETTIKPEDVVRQAPVRIFDKSVPDKDKLSKINLPPKELHTWIKWLPKAKYDVKVYVGLYWFMV